MKKSYLASAVTLFLLIPLTLYFGLRLTGRGYYLTATLIVVESMVPFFLAFERRRPQARELVTLAVMAALAAVSRVAFNFIPHFKPITAVIMITGIAFGPQAGFLTGAVSAFASNLYFGQGPWTPWQMMAYGVGGFLAGLVFYGRKVSDKPWLTTLVYTIFGFAAIVVVVGPLLDLCTLFTTGSQVTPAFAAAIFLSGLPVNLTHGLACGLTMLLFSWPLLEKLERLKIKYGMMEADGDGL